MDIGSVSFEERLTWDDLRAAYPDQWVMLVDLRWLDDQLYSGIAIGHGDQRSAAIAHGLPLLAPESSFACFYTGPAEAPARRFLAPPVAVFESTVPMFLPRLAS